MSAAAELELFTQYNPYSVHPLKGAKKETLCIITARVQDTRRWIVHRDSEKHRNGRNRDAGNPRRTKSSARE